MKRIVLGTTQSAIEILGLARCRPLFPLKLTVTRLLLASVVLTLCPIAHSQTVWDGPPIIFTKTNGSDWTSEKNQDRITDIVWITRQDSAGIFNFYAEGGYSSQSPADTEWASGSATNWRDLVFQNWVQWANNNPPSTIGLDAVVHLISEDIYIDITFLSWTCCGGGGGFSYERSTPPTACPWDLDGSGDVAVGDLLEVLAAWGPNPGHPADFDGDDTVGLSDLLELLANWGPCP